MRSYTCSITLLAWTSPASIVIPAPAGFPVSYVESQWHRISAELEADRALTRLADMLDRDPCWDDLRTLASVQGVVLDQAGRLMRLMATQRVSSFLNGQTVLDIAQIADEGEAPEPMDQRTARHEVGLALGRTKDQAQFLITTYTRLVQEFPDFVTALTAGRITLGHCYALHEETLVVTDPAALARIAGKALPLATAQSTTRFRTALRRLIARHDPNAADRRRQARLAAPGHLLQPRRRHLLDDRRRAHRGRRGDAREHRRRRHLPDHRRPRRRRSRPTTSPG